jgi:hypothetical protein
MQGRRDDLVAALFVMGLVLVSWGARESDERWIWRRVGGATRVLSVGLSTRREAAEPGRTEEAGRHSGASRGQRVENAPIFPQCRGWVAFSIIVALVQLLITWNAWWGKSRKNRSVWWDSRFFMWTIGLKAKPNTPAVTCRKRSSSNFFRYLYIYKYLFL